MINGEIMFVTEPEKWRFANRRNRTPRARGVTGRRVP